MLKSLRFDIWRRIAERFSIEDQPPGPPPASISKTIQLTSEVNELLETPNGYDGADDISAAASYFVQVTALSNQRIRVLNVAQEATTGVSCPVVNIDGNSIRLTPIGTGPHTAHGLTIRLNPGDSFGVLTTGNGADIAIRTSWVYYSEVFEAL